MCASAQQKIVFSTVMPSLTVARAHASASGGVFLSQKEYADLLASIDDLRLQLKEAQDALNAIAKTQGVFEQQTPCCSAQDEWKRRIARNSHP